MDARLQEALSDRYAIEREIGAGAMATVWLARDLKHDRQVAIKVLHPQLAAVLGAERFLKEIRTAAHFHHPHILPLFDSGSAGDALYYVMPFVDGESLRQRLTREKRLPIPEAIRIATEISSALDYSHRHGVIHRDIKPENILLHDGRAFVADFGIALARAVDGDRLTETGLTVGTPAYMSPEQAVGDPGLDARSDIHAVGALLYEMLTGVPPFVGPSAQATVANLITQEPVPPSRLRRKLPVGLSETVLTALQKRPADRFPTAAALQAALEQCVHARERRAWMPSVRASAALAIILAVVAGAAYAATRRTVTEGAPREASIAAIPFQVEDSADVYLGEQMPAEILDALTHVPGLIVRPLASAAQFTRERDLSRIAATLKVATLLTGSVRREGRSIRITARLFDASRNVSLPAVSFTNDASNKFELEDSVSARIVSGFELTQTAAQLALAHAGRTSNSSAHDSLMVARWYAEQRTPHGLTRAITLYNEAIRLDSSYADAWAGLASALNLRGVFEDSASVPYFAKGKSIVLHALALDSNSALAHTEYGFTKVFYDRDYAGAQTEFARAIALDSMQSATWLFRGWAYLGEDKVDLALRSMRHGWQIDPASLIVGTRLGTVLYFADSMQAAEQQLRAVLKLDKNFTFAGIQLAQVYADQHQCSEALRVLPETPLPFGSPDDLNRVYTWARCNDLPRAQGYLDTVEIHARSGGYANPLFVATIYAALQNEAGMYRWLNVAVAQNNWALFMLRRHPAFRPYRSEPAFQALLREAQAQSARRRELSMSFFGAKFRSGS